MLNKATTLKNIAEQVDDDFAEVFDNIIKDIEVADSVEKVVFAGNKLANKLLEWHKILSEYHNKGYHKEGVDPTTIEGKLDYLKGNAQKMVADNGSGDKLYTGGLNELANVATEIAGNLKTDIADVIDDVKGYKGFHRADFTAAVQANTLVTFLKDKVSNVSNLKFVDKQTREKLAKDIKHIFDQIKIDQKTGKYYLPGFYNRYAVTQDDLKLICEAYDVVAGDFGARPVYLSPKEGKGLTFKDQVNVLAQTLSNVQRLDLLDVSPESRVVLKNDIMEIGAKIKSTPGWIYGRTLSLDGVDQKETKDMQDGLAGILEFYNSIQAQTKAQK